MIRQLQRKPPKKTTPVQATLKIQSRNAQETRVHYTDLEAFVNKVLAKDFKFLKSAGVTHGMIPEYLVSGEVPNTPEINRRVAAIRNGRVGVNVGLMLNLLAKENRIGTGLYVIDTHKKPFPLDVYRQLLEDHRDPDHPECRRLRREHQKDKVFTLNATILDQACREIYTPPERAV